MKTACFFIEILDLSAELSAGGNAVIQNHQVQLFLALYLAHSGEEHAVGHLAHHLSGGQIEDGNDGLANKLLGLIELVDSGENLAGSAAAIVQRELKELVALDRKSVV